MLPRDANSADTRAIVSLSGPSTIFTKSYGPNVAYWDTTFTPSVAGVVRTLALQPDGRILVGGDFTSLEGSPRNHLGRLNPDGRLDTFFISG